MPSEPKRVSFAPNIQQQLALADLDAVLESHSWGDQWYYQLTDGRILYVSEEVARKINMLDLRPGESFVIVKRCGAQARQPIRWDVWRAGEGEKEIAREDTDLAKLLQQSVDEVQSRRGMATPRPAPKPPEPEPPTPAPLPPAASNVRPLKAVPQQMSFPWAEKLKNQSKALVDTYAATLEYASEKYGNKIPREDIRSLTISAFISQAQGRGGSSAA